MRRAGSPGAQGCRCSHWSTPDRCVRGWRSRPCRHVSCSSRSPRRGAACAVRRTCDLRVMSVEGPYRPVSIGVISCRLPGLSRAPRVVWCRPLLGPVSWSVRETVRETVRRSAWKLNLPATNKLTFRASQSRLKAGPQSTTLQHSHASSTDTPGDSQAARQRGRQDRLAPPAGLAIVGRSTHDRRRSRSLHRTGRQEGRRACPRPQAT